MHHERLETCKTSTGTAELCCALERETRSNVLFSLSCKQANDQGLSLNLSSILYHQL
jgi:hypothetical protein